jgi:SAM-dependent methyltransferase
LKKQQGWHGWDAYAPFYDWENAQTLDRRDVAFWRRLATRARGRVLELGCGTGRVTIPVARAGVRIVGVDRSSEMLAHACRRTKRARLGRRVSWIRGDIRSLPLRRAARFDLVMAPYGILQSLVRESDLSATLASVAGILPKAAPSVSIWCPICRCGRNTGTRCGFGAFGAGADRALRSLNQCARTVPGN